MYAPASAIVPVTGEVPLAASRLDPAFGNVLVLESTAKSWNYSLSGRSLTGRPPIGDLERRMELTISVFNLLGGLDRLFHGTDIKGWGANNQIFGAEPLLFVRGFNPSTNSFIYQVNQSFARPRWLLFGGANPFQVQLSVRFQIGSFGPGPGGFGGPGGPGGPGGDRRPGR